MIKVNVYRTVGHMDRQFVATKWFHTQDKAKQFCKFVAPKLYQSGNYEFIIVKK
jgi:hypothetical protein